MKDQPQRICQSIFPKFSIFSFYRLSFLYHGLEPFPLRQFDVLTQIILMAYREIFDFFPIIRIPQGRKQDNHQYPSVCAAPLLPSHPYSSSISGTSALLSFSLQQICQIFAAIFSHAFVVETEKEILDNRETM